jgi:hypothetical protein
VRQSRDDGKFIPVKEHTMSLNEPLNAELEAQAQELAGRIRARADEDILALARLLVSKNDAEVFGDTEFEARNIVHHLGAAALEERLKKNLAMKDLASTAPAAGSPRSSRGTARKRR